MAVVTVDVPEETVASHRRFAIDAIQKNASLDGFRKGHVPEKVLVEKVGEMAVLSEAAEITISHLYPHILEAEKLDAIGSPKVAITKLAPGNPLQFVLEIFLMPEVTLPDYKAIAKKQNTAGVNIDVTDADVEEAVTRVLRQKMAYDRIQEKAAKKQEAEAAGLTLPTPDTAEETGEEDYSKLPLPELTDDVAKTLGAFETAAQFKDEIRKHLGTEKEREATSRRRGALTDAIVEGTTIDLPQILIDSEIGQMMGEMESDITRAGLTVDDYLTHVKKTKEDLHKEWTPTAEKRAKLQLVLNEIAKQEAIEPDEAKVAVEVSGLLSRFEGADPTRARIYVESILRNDAVMEMLEKIS
jgi:trigger factor